MWKMNQFASALKMLIREKEARKSNEASRTIKSISEGPIYHTRGSLGLTFF